MLAHMRREMLPLLFRAGAPLQLVDRNPPLVLGAAMLAADLVDTPVERPPETEIIPANRQDFRRFDCAEHPIRKFDIKIAKAFGKARALAVVIVAVDQPEILRRFFVAGFDVGFDAGAGQTIERVLEPLVDDAAGVAIGRDQQIMRRYSHIRPDRLP